MLTTIREDSSLAFSRAARAYGWIAVGVIVLALLAYRVWQVHHRAIITAQWQAKVAAARQAARSADRRVQQLYARHVLKWTVQDLQKELNEGKPFAVVDSEPGYMQVKWTDPAGGQRFNFTFSQHRWSGMTSGWSSSSLPPPPGPSRLEGSIEDLRRTFAGWNSGVGPVIWIGLLMLFGLVRRLRAILAELLLAMALLCGAAWLINPNYPLAPNGIFSNDMLFWAAVMLITGGVAVFVTSRVRGREESVLCRSCRYSLVGNVSGVCPECGASVPEDLRSRLAIHAGRG